MLFKDQSMKMKRTQNLPLMNKPTLFKGLLLVACFFLSSWVYGQSISVAAINDANEDGSQNAIFRVSSSLPLNSNDIIVDFVISGGTATSGVDYTAPASSSVTIPGNFFGSFVDISIPALQDALIESNETIQITLTNSDSGTIVQNTDVANIIDDDVAIVTILATDANATEATPANQTGAFTVDIGGVNATGGPITINFNTSGAAINDTDYTNIGTSIGIPNGQQTAVVTIIPIDDNLIENSEIVTLTLSNGPGYTVGAPNTAAVNIVDNDVASASISVTDATAAESTPANQTGTFTINLGKVNATGSPITVNFTRSGSATHVSDYANIGASVNVPNNSQTANIVIAPVNDNDVEGDETVSLTLASGPGYVVGSPDNATITIEDNDNANLSIANSAVLENVVSGNLVFVVTLDNAVPGGTQVGYTFSNGTAMGSGVDFTATPGTLTFTGTANETRNITVAIINDALVEANETFTVQLGTPTNGVLLTGSGNATGTINNDDTCAAGGTAPVLNSATPTNFCDVIDVSLNDYTTSNTANIRWSTNSNASDESAHLTPAAVNNPLENGGTYYGFFWDDVNNCPSPTLTVNISLGTTPTITNSNGDTRCGPGVVNLSATASSGQVRWYTALTGGTAVNNLSNYSPNITQTTTYYVEAFANTCTSSPRVAVVATVNPTVSAGIANNTSSCSNATYGTTTVDLDNQLTGASAGVWVFTSGPQNVVPDPQNVVNFVGVPDGNYVYTFTTTGAQAPCTNDSESVTISVSSCDTDNDGDGLFGGTEQALGTEPNNADTDDDGINDGVEVGPDINNPLDQDNDGIIDALESIILDEDNDGVVDQLDPNNSNPCVPNVTSGLCPVDLEIKKEVDSPNTSLGSTVTFTVTVTNVSDTPLQSAQIGELLETGFEYVSHEAAEGSSYDPETSVWDIAELEPNANTTLEITVLVLEDGVYSNTAELLASSPADANGANDSATVNVSLGYPPGYDLLLEKRAVSVSPLVGDEVTFTIRVTNQSTESAPMTNIVVEDVIQDNDSLPKFIYNSHTSDVGTYIVETGRWTIPSLAQYSVATLTIKVLVPREGIFVNTARILGGDDNLANNEDFVTIKVSTATKVDVGILYNQFSPNGDETNEVLKINRTDFDSDERPLVPLVYSIQIFNRYGALVFEGNDSFDDVDQREAEVWDGTWKNEDAPAGTYFYVLEFDLNNGQGPQISKGWIQLIR